MLLVKAYAGMSSTGAEYPSGAGCTTSMALNGVLVPTAVAVLASAFYRELVYLFIHFNSMLVGLKFRMVLIIINSLINNGLIINSLKVG